MTKTPQGTAVLGEFFSKRSFCCYRENGVLSVSSFCQRNGIHHADLADDLAVFIQHIGIIKFQCAIFDLGKLLLHLSDDLIRFARVSCFALTASSNPVLTSLISA